MSYSLKRNFLLLWTGDHWARVRERDWHFLSIVSWRTKVCCQERQKNPKNWTCRIKSPWGPVELNNFDDTWGHCSPFPTARRISTSSASVSFISNGFQSSYIFKYKLIMCKSWGEGGGVQKLLNLALGENTQPPEAPFILCVSAAPYWKPGWSWPQDCFRHSRILLPGLPAHKAHSSKSHVFFEREKSQSINNCILWNWAELTDQNHYLT